MLRTFNIATPKEWEFDDNGFLRCRARFIASGIMQYAGDELGEAVQSTNATYHIMVPQTTIEDPHSIRSLEGMPVISYEHEWAEVDGDQKQVGTIAGTPKINGGFLEGEIIIRDPDTITAIKAGELKEISAGYNAVYNMEPGEHDGQQFDGKQSELRYNHIALLRSGEGRGGSDVRILNKKGAFDMQDLINVSLGSGQTVRVLNADGELLSNFIKQQTTNQDESKETAETMNELMTKLEEANKTRNENQAEIDDLSGKLLAIKEQLEAALSPAEQEAVAEAMLGEKDEASDMLVENGIEEDKEKAVNSIKGLRGHDLRLHIVKSVRTANSLVDLSDSDCANEGKVSGIYQTYKETPKKQKTVNGASANAHANTAKVERNATQKLGY